MSLHKNVWKSFLSPKHALVVLLKVSFSFAAMPTLSQKWGADPAKQDITKMSYMKKVKRDIERAALMQSVVTTSKNPKHSVVAAKHVFPLLCYVGLGPCAAATNAGLYVTNKMLLSRSAHPLVKHVAPAAAFALCGPSTLALNAGLYAGAQMIGRAIRPSLKSSHEVAGECLKGSADASLSAICGTMLGEGIDKLSDSVVPSSRKQAKLKKLVGARKEEVKLVGSHLISTISGGF